MTCSPNNEIAEHEPTPVEQAALGWVVRSDRELSGDQRCALADWLRADSKHAELFDEFGGTWTLMGRRAKASGRIWVRWRSP